MVQQDYRTALHRNCGCSSGTLRAQLQWSSHAQVIWRFVPPSPRPCDCDQAEVPRAALLRQNLKQSRTKGALASARVCVYPGHSSLPLKLRVPFHVMEGSVDSVFEDGASLHPLKMKMKMLRRHNEIIAGVEEIFNENEVQLIIVAGKTANSLQAKHTESSNQAVWEDKKTISFGAMA